VPVSLLDRLDTWKSRYGARDYAPLERLLLAARKARWSDAASLIRLHETALFLRAWPPTPQAARLADAILFSFSSRIAELPTNELSAFAEPEVSGIAGTSLSAVFCYEVARSLHERYPGNVELAWDCYDGAERLGPLLARWLMPLGEEWPVEAHVPYREWISAARDGAKSDLAWLLERAQAESFDALEAPLTWRIADARSSRSRLRLPGKRLFCHTEPLLRRSDVSLAEQLESPPLPVRRLPPREARKLLDLMLDTSAMRYRQLYGFSHPDETGVFHADAGRGVDIFFFGVPARRRLPIRAYHAGMFFKNGVPAGYIELLSLFERAETGFNLYYTFREGESAWLYARLLRLFHQALGVSCFSVDPYQIGLENSEAIDSGAFWFYRKLGFRPVDPRVAALTAGEERRMRQTPGYRSPQRTLEKLAADCVIFEAPSAEKGAWDRFRIHNISLACADLGFDGRMRRAASRRIARALGVESASGLAMAMSRIPGLEAWTSEEKAAAAAVLRAKEDAGEARYLKLMQRHRRLRAAFLAMGSESARPSDEPCAIQ